MYKGMSALRMVHVDHKWKRRVKSMDSACQRRKEFVTLALRWTHVKHDVKNISKRHVCLEVNACKKEMKKSRQMHGECMLRRRRFCNMSKDGMEAVVMPVKASSNLKIRTSWIFTGGIRRFTMHSSIDGTSVKILVLLSLMNLTPMMMMSCSLLAILHPLEAPPCSIDALFPISGRAFLWPPTGSSTSPTSRSMADSCIAASGYSCQRYKAAQLLYNYLCFMHPFPLLLMLSSPLDSNAKKLAVVMSGLNRDNTEFFDSPVAPFAAEFLSALNTQKTPKNSSWDLASGNCLSIATEKHLVYLHDLSWWWLKHGTRRGWQQAQGQAISIWLQASSNSALDHCSAWSYKCLIFMPSWSSAYRMWPCP